MSNRYMARAVELAVENVRSGKGGPFAALVVRAGQVIAEGANQVTSTNDPTAHAEIVAIREACRGLKDFQLSGCDLYTTCEPCPMCMAAIYWARPARVFFAATAADAARFGFDDFMIGQELQRPWPERRIPMSQVMPEEALVAFHEWQRKSDKVEY